MSTECNVLIVGAGAAGLSAARHLIQNGIEDIIILEASDRIGGRIDTVSFGNDCHCVVELGANYIHGGTMENPLYALAVGAGILPAVPDLLDRRQGFFYNSNGLQIDKDLGLRAFDIFEEVDREASSADVRDWAKVDHNLKGFIDDRLNEELWAFNEEERPLAATVFNCLLNYLSYYIGDNVSLVGLKNYSKYEEFPGGNVIVPFGFNSIVEVLAHDIPQSVIRLRSKVTLIEWPGERLRKDRVIIRTERGITYSCKHVIVTIPAGNLKNCVESLFSPSLPKKKQLAIKQLGFGRSEKIFLCYKKPFWCHYEIPIHLAWSSQEDMSSDNSVSDEEEKWYESVVGFDTVYENCNVLACRITGPAAEEMETLSLNEIAQDLTTVLHRFTGNPTISPPQSVIRSSWSSNPLFCGSYTYLAPGSEGEEIDILSEPLPSQKRPQLLFAGEGTHPKYFSTVHGAMLTGIREADRIISYNKRNGETNIS